MKIGIEAQRIFRKKKHGMDMVAVELIRNLQQIDHENEYTIFVNPDEDNLVIQETANFKIIPLKGGSYPFWEQIALPKAAVKYGCQLLHCTSNTAPVFCKIPLIITLHDIIYMESSSLNLLKSSGSNYQKFGNMYRRMVVPNVVRKSKKIITVSDFEKNCIADFFGLQNDRRLTTVYNGVSDYFKPVNDKDILKTVKEKYNLPEKYIFFLGNTHPKKNTKGTLIAFAELLRQTGMDIKLVMIDYDSNELQNLLQEINAPELINYIVLTGYVINQDLPAIYAQCQLFLYPSLRESFGIPLIEAMACGVPVITSDTSSMPEIAGDAALLINPFKPEEISTAMIKVLTDEKLKCSMVMKGIRQASKFSWNAMAEEVLNVYKEVEKESSQILPN